MEINSTTVQFQKNILIHAIKNTIQEEGLKNIENLERKLITRIDLEIYSMMSEDKFNLSVGEVIPFLMLFESVETSLIVNGEDVRLTCRFNERMNSYVMHIEYKDENIGIKCSIIEDRLKMELI